MTLDETYDFRDAIFWKCWRRISHTQYSPKENLIRAIGDLEFMGKGADVYRPILRVFVSHMSPEPTDQIQIYINESYLIYEI